MSDDTPPIPGVHHTLAAIVFTDIAGYSTLVEQDEPGTLAAAERDFALMRERCAAHDGSVVKTTGDGLLCAFSSAVKAVGFAVEVQDLLRKARDAAAGPALHHRIGVHVGDVVVREDDVHGDGVNVAARIQAEAPPGGIAVSQTVYDVVRNKLELQVRFLGERELKNLRTTVPVYEILGTAAAGRRARPRTRREFPWKIAASALAGALAVTLLLLFALPWLRQRALQPAARPERAASADTQPDAGIQRPALVRTDNVGDRRTGPLGIAANWARDHVRAHGPEWLDVGNGRSVRASDSGALEVRDASGIATLEWDNLPPRLFAEVLVALLEDGRARGRAPEPRILLAAGAFARRLGYNDLVARLRTSFGPLPEPDAGTGPAPRP